MRGDQSNTQINIDTLKRLRVRLIKSVRGADIHVRPSASNEQAFVMLDDTNTHTINEAKRLEYAPAAVVEVVPGNHQAWIRLADEKLTPDISKGTHEALKQKLKVSTNDYGLMAGFKSTANNGHRITCTEATGQQAKEGEGLIARIKGFFAKRKAEKEQEKRVEAIQRHTAGDFGRDPVMTYRNEYKRLTSKGGNDSDPSSIDYEIAKTLALAKFDKDTIVKTLKDCSPEQPTRKLNGNLSYCNDITDKAIASREVSMASVSDRARARARARDWKSRNRNQEDSQRNTPSNHF